MGSSRNGADKVKYRGSSTLFPKKLHFLKLRITKCLKNMFSSIEVKFCWMIANSCIGKHLLFPKWVDYTEKVSLRDWQTTACGLNTAHPLFVYCLRCLKSIYIFKWLENNQKKENISWYIKFYEIQVSVSRKKKFIYVWTPTCLLDYSHPHSLIDYLGLFLHSNNKVE